MVHTESEPTVTSRPSRGRAVAAAVCLVLAALLTVPAATAYWGQRTLNDSQRYLDTVGPLVHSPEVQTAITETVTGAIQRQVDVEAVLDQAFAGVITDRPRLQALVGPMAGAVNGFVESQVRSFVASDAFADFWVTANTRAQAGLIRLLQGDQSGAISLQENQVVLDLSQVIDAVKQRLVARGLTLVDRIPIPDKDRQVVLMEAPQLNQARTIYAFASPVAAWLIVVVAALYLAAFVLSRHRPRMTVIIGVLLAVNAMLVALVLVVGRQLFVNQLAGTVFGPASAVFYDQLLSYLQRGQQVFLWVGLTLVVVGWFAASSGKRPRRTERRVRWVGDPRGGRCHRSGGDRRPLGRRQRALAASGDRRRRRRRAAVGQRPLHHPAAVVPGPGGRAARPRGGARRRGTQREPHGSQPRRRRWMTMSMERPALTARFWRTRRSAAVAGIAFSLLLITALTLARLALSDDSLETLRLDEPRRTMIRVSLNLVPFAGIAFLWFIGVVREQLGEVEDRLFSTVFLGSGLLFLAMLFIGSVTSTSLVEMLAGPNVNADVWAFGRDNARSLVSVYAMRMAAVFTLSVSTVGIRTGAVPRWVSFVGYAVALSLLLAAAEQQWAQLLFPAWVLLLSHGHPPLRPEDLQAGTRAP